MKCKPSSQQGVALVVSLILLLLLTVLAITAATNSSLQQRMAANAQDMNAAFQATESGLARWIKRFNETTKTTTIEGSIGNASIEVPGVTVQANCVAGSLGTSGFIFDCYHVTSTATSADGTAIARHQMGYLTRTGQ